MENHATSTDNKLLLFIVGFLIILAAVFGSGVVKNLGIPSGANLLGSNQTAQGPSVVGGPSLSAQKVDAILSSAQSPAAGTGQALYDLSAQYGIDDAFALGVFKHESNYGKYGVASQSLSLGNLRCIPDAACVNDYAYFNSWQDGYRAFYALISGPLYKGSGLTTPEAIMARYAPSGDNNDPVGYAADVSQSMQAWRQS